MDSIKEIIMIAGVLGISFILASLLLGLYYKWANCKNQKISEAYKKAVEKHQLSEKEYPRFLEVEDLPMDAQQRKARIDRARRSTGDYSLVPSQLVDSNFNLWGLGDSTIESSLGEMQIHNGNGNGYFTSSYDSYDGSDSRYYGAGHGGSFGGGGGASGSWGSDDHSSSSYDSGSSDSGGSDSSSSD